MINEEVGVSAETEEVFAENIYLVPLPEGAGLNDIRIFILADGNNRAQAEGKDYDDGGKNVIRIAEHMAERGDVSMMVACILSPENIDKRSDAFFAQIYEAFIKLGVRMKTHGTLLDAGVKVEIAGSLERLRAKGGHAEKLVNAIEAVMEMTNAIEKPRTRLLLGVDYDPDVAQDKAVTLMFRSGMEEDDSVRSSGIKMHPCIPFYGTTELWPNVSPEQMDEIIDDVRNSMKTTLGAGYSNQMTEELIVSLKSSNLEGKFALAMNTLATFTDVALMLKHNKNPRGARVCFEVKGSDGENFRSCCHKSGECTQLVTINADAAILRDDNYDYSTFLVPGQQERDFFTLPSHPQIKYATALKCEETPEGIINGIRRAVDFHQTHESMKGAERVVKNENVELYFQELQTFVDHMCEWGEQNDIPLDTDHQRKAFANYMLTCFYMFNYKLTDHKEALARAKTEAQYMASVYKFDEVVGDCPLVSEEEISANAASFSNCIRGKDAAFTNRDIESAAKILRSIVEQLQNAGSDAFCVDLFVTTMEKYYAAGLAETDDSSYEIEVPATSKEFMAKFKVPSCVSTSLETDYDHIPTWEKDIYAFLSKIEASMGAGQAFLLVAASDDNNLPEHLKPIMEDLYLLANFFYRIANDVSGHKSRATDDPEIKRDCFSIIRKYFPFAIEEEMSEKLERIAFDLYRAMKQLFVKIKDEAPSIGIPIERSEVAMMIYGHGHYRSLSLESSFNLIKTKLDIGL